VVDAFVLSDNSIANNETFNICGDSEMTLMQFVELASMKLKKNPKIEFGPVRAGDQAITKGKNSKAQDVIGWKPKVDFDYGVELQIRKFFQDL